MGRGCRLEICKGFLDINVHQSLSNPEQFTIKCGDRRLTNPSKTQEDAKMRAEKWALKLLGEIKESVMQGVDK